MKNLRVLGVMTGNSCDGLDASCLEFESERSWRVLWEDKVRYPSRLRQRVLDIQNPKVLNHLGVF